VNAAAAAVAVTALGVAALLAAERRGLRAGVWIAKPLASTGFVAFAWLAGAGGTGYGRAILAALVLCWLGDVLLIPKGARGAFGAGLASFLAGHAVYAGAFASGPFATRWALVAAAAVLPAAALALRWLRPHVPRALALPVVAYVAVISAMVVAAAGATGGTRELAILSGAVAFFVSDLAVARERFVASTFWNKAWGLPLYYGAQLLLASSVASRMAT
jgi:uncharacterized membrane protein YhhN